MRPKQFWREVVPDPEYVGKAAGSEVTERDALDLLIRWTAAAQSGEYGLIADGPDIKAALKK